MLTRGDPAPWFVADSTLHPKSQFYMWGGRYVVLSFLGSAGLEASQQLLAGVDQHRDRFEKLGAAFCGVSSDPEDQQLARGRTQWSGGMCFWDFDYAVAQLYGVSTPESDQYQTQSLILDPMMRVIAAIPFEQNGEAHLQTILAVFDRLPPLASIRMFPPVLILPFIFEPEFCQTLISLYEKEGGLEGVMQRDVNGQSVQVTDHSRKSRKDCHITDPALVAEVENRLRRRVFPEIKKAYQYSASQFERYLVSCYEAATGAHFAPHRDNTTHGSAHRRFAVSVNLNADYEGGDLRFPEFGYATYRAPAGGAVVFSCSLLHEVLPVTKGKRYAFLPFIHNDDDIKIRDANAAFVSDAVRQTKFTTGAPAL